jgi:hypothetical protein
VETPAIIMSASERWSIRAAKVSVCRTRCAAAARMIPRRRRIRKYSST